MRIKILSILGMVAMGSVAAHAIEQPQMNGKLRVTTLSPNDIRYTGKPYSQQLGAYVFNYRNLDPAINRWTTSDPSGFPDGANNQIYAPRAFVQVDAMGLDAGDGTTISDASTHIQATNGTHSVTVTATYGVKQTDTVPDGDLTTRDVDFMLLVHAPMTFTYSDDHGNLTVNSSTGLTLQGEATNTTNGLSASLGIFSFTIAGTTITYNVTASTSNGKTQLIIDWTLSEVEKYTLKGKIPVGDTGVAIPVSKSFNYTNEQAEGRIILQE